MQKFYSANRIEIVFKVLIEFAAAIRAFAARLPEDKVPASGRAAAIRAFQLDAWETVLPRGVECIFFV